LPSSKRVNEERDSEAGKSVWLCRLWGRSPVAASLERRVHHPPGVEMCIGDSCSQRFVVVACESRGPKQSEFLAAYLGDRSEWPAVLAAPALGDCTE